ncbi:MAG: hypothetical protein AAF296_04465 [Pseudomonadota bacterium]
MAEFGPNGAVITPPSAGDYRRPPAKVKRVALACFICAIAASASVALVAFGLMTALRFAVTMVTESSGYASVGVLGGANFAMSLAALNWVLFFITIPAAWLAIGLSIGQFPHRHIIAASPYYRWSAIWGAILVGVTCSVFGAFASLGMQALGFWLSATLTGLFIGVLAGLICGALFRAIVRPEHQIRQVEIEAF